MSSEPGLPVVLSVPAQPSYLRLVRLVVASMAADAGFDFDSVEDLRIAADELINTVMSVTRPGAAVSIEVLVDEGQLILSSTAPAGPDHASVSVDPLAAQILSALVDDSSFEVRGTDVAAGFRKAAPVAVA
jgi:serine/threonine-protein kinase RsbW